MKKIEIDNLEDSTAFYLNRPNPIVKVLVISLSISIICIFFIFLFANIEVQVKGNGIVSNSKSINYITNPTSAKIKKCCIKDGEKIKKGEIIYILDCSEDKKKLTNLNEKLKKIEDSIEIGAAYYKWLCNPERKIKLNKNNSYYEEYKVKYEYIKSTIDLNDQNDGTAISELKLEIYHSKNKLKKLESRISSIKSTISSVKKIKNEVDVKGKYYSYVEIFLSEYKNLYEEYENTIKLQNDNNKKRNYEKKAKRELEQLKNEKLLTLYESRDELYEQKEEEKDTLEKMEEKLKEAIKYGHDLEKEIVLDEEKIEVFKFCEERKKKKMKLKWRF